MENLTISDPPPPLQQQQQQQQHGGPGGMPPALGRPPPPPQQLPAQMFTTAAQLLDLTDSKRDSAPTNPCDDPLTNSKPEKLMLALRDGRKLVGILRSWDQFGMSRHAVESEVLP
jgi:U6 snRNA-associated Sm-like protein LSm1